jgi:hypothetical protein
MGPVARDIPPIVQIAIGCVIGLIAFAIPLSCGAGSARLPALVACKLEAIDKVLPAEPGMLSIYDAIDIWERVRACNRAHPDAGAP